METDRPPLTGDHPRQSAKARAVIEGEDLFVSTTECRALSSANSASLCSNRILSFRESAEKPKEDIETLRCRRRGGPIIKPGSIMARTATLREHNILGDDGAPSS